MPTEQSVGLRPLRLGLEDILKAELQTYNQATQLPSSLRRKCGMRLSLRLAGETAGETANQGFFRKSQSAKKAWLQARNLQGARPPVLAASVRLHGTRACVKGLDRCHGLSVVLHAGSYRNAAATRTAWRPPASSRWCFSFKL